MITLFRRSHALGALLLSVSLSACLTSTATGAARWPYLSSAELERMSDPDTVYIRHMRTFEKLVRSVNTDSLAKLYLGSLDAPSEDGVKYKHAILCQFEELFHRYGRAAPRRAILLLEDSLFTTPAERARWAAAQDRWPIVLGDDYRCAWPPGSMLPDSLNWYPTRMRPTRH